LHVGLPVNNIIPDFNDLVYKQDWQHAIETLHSPTIFPSSRPYLPAPCEEACVLASMTTRSHQVGRARDHRQGVRGSCGKTAAARAQDRQERRRGGLGPAGSLAPSSSLALGTTSRCSKKNDRIGGLLRYGIPDFKMEKGLIEPPGRPNEG